MGNEGSIIGKEKGYLVVGRYYAGSPSGARARAWSAYDWSHASGKGAPIASWQAQGISTLGKGSAEELVAVLADNYCVAKCPLRLSAMVKSPLVVAQFYMALPNAPKEPVKGTVRTIILDDCDSLVSSSCSRSMWGGGKPGEEELMIARRLFAK